MNDLQKFQQTNHIRSIDDYETTDRNDTDSVNNVITPILRRWWIVLLTVLLICSATIPAVWHYIKPTYSATAAIRVAPVIPSILFGDKDSDGVKPMYYSYMNTQADLMTSNKILQRVVDELADKNLYFFAQTPDPVLALKSAVAGGTLTVGPERNSELIKITMRTKQPRCSEQIVNALVRAYMGTEVSDTSKDGDHKLAVLESERKALAEKLHRQQQAIRQMAEEYGSVALTGRQNIMLQKIESFEAELARVQIRRISLQSKISIFDADQSDLSLSDNLIKMRQDFINADLTIKALTTSIVQLEQALIIAGQTLAPTNPELERKTNLLAALKERLTQRRREVEDSFDIIISQEWAKMEKSHLANAQTELSRLRLQEETLTNMLQKENVQTIGIGRKQLAIEDLQDQFDMTKALYETVRKRIQELEMERKRPARISVAYYADVIGVPTKRVKYTAAAVFGAFVCGIFFAFITDKADKSMHSPDDLTKQIGVRIIGTTTNSVHTIKSMLPQQLADDYQNICANIALLNNNTIPPKMVVTSAATQEGKTTFAINLATSLVKSGKKVLLIDGDLRKPDIATFLNIDQNHIGIERLLADIQGFGKYFYSMAESGLSVLIAKPHDALDTFRILGQLRKTDLLDTLSKKYDHLIIDTPPILAVPDALLWAKMADAVVLTSFAGHSTSPDLKEALQRLHESNIMTIGTVLNNVTINHSYNRYSYDYASADRQTKKQSRRRKNKNKANLLPMNQRQ